MGRLARLRHGCSGDDDLEHIQPRRALHSSERVCAALARANRRHRASAEERTAAWKAEAAKHQATTSQLRETVERFEQVINNITEVFWLTNPEKTEMIYISPGYERIWGRTCEALRANPQSWLDALHPDDRAEITRRSKTEQTSSAYDVEYRIIRSDGTERGFATVPFPFGTPPAKFTVSPVSPKTSLNTKG